MYTILINNVKKIRKQYKRHMYKRKCHEFKSVQGTTVTQEISSEPQC